MLKGTYVNELKKKNNKMTQTILQISEMLNNMNIVNNALSKTPRRFNDSP